MENEEKTWMSILGKIAEIVKSCPHFDDWDWCNDHCPILYRFCDQVVVVHDAMKIIKK